MKKLILICCSILLIGLGSQAQQQDTERNKSKKQGTQYKKDQSSKQQSDKETDMAREQKRDQTSQQRQKTGATAQGDQQTDYDVVIVQTTDIPASMRTTLEQGEEYKGWENAIIYYNKKTDEYLVSPRPFRFDGQGNPLPYDDNMGYGQRKSTRTKKNQKNQSSPDNTSDRNTQQSQSNRDQESAQNDDRRAEQNRDDDALSSQQQSDDDEDDANVTRNEDTQPTQPQSRRKETGQSDRYRTDNSTQNQNAQREEPSTEGMVIIEAEDVPTTLRTTLQEEQYKGWENGKLYRNNTSGEYLLILTGPNSDLGNKTTYRFDRQGKLIKDQTSND